MNEAQWTLGILFVIAVWVWAFKSFLPSRPKPAHKPRVFRHILRLKFTDGGAKEYYHESSKNLGPTRLWRDFLKWYHTGTSMVFWITVPNRRVGIIRTRIAVFDLEVEEYDVNSRDA